MAPNATRALIAIGLGDKIATVGTSSPGIYTRNMQTGEFIEFNDRRKNAARFGAPYYSFHRADLLNALASGLDHRLIHLDHRLVGVEERSDGVTLAFANGACRSEFVIGADGVRSSSAMRSTATTVPPTQWSARAPERLRRPREVLSRLTHPMVGPVVICWPITSAAKLVNIVTQEDTDNGSRKAGRPAATPTRCG